jgi:hypothetical protein
MTRLVHLKALRLKTRIFECKNRLVMCPKLDYPIFSHSDEGLFDCKNEVNATFGIIERSKRIILRRIYDTSAQTKSLDYLIDC